MDNLRTYGPAPYRVAVVHGGPGARGEMAAVARRLSARRGVLEPLQTATSLAGQVEELRAVLAGHAQPPVTLIGFSWGAWLSYILAACHPAIVGELILVGSGPFEAKYAARIAATRRSRLSEEEGSEFEAILNALGQPALEDQDALLARLGALTQKTDQFDPLPEGSQEAALAEDQGAIFAGVWQAAAEMRRRGELLALAGQIQCPVVAIHGAYDPHPAEGVEAPLAAALQDFQFFLLENCGHKPWIERQAKDGFYALLDRALS